MCVNPYNFVRLQPMADGMRGAPRSHNNPGSYDHSGRFICRIIAIGPIFIKPFESLRDRNTFESQLLGNHNGENRYHKIYKKFFNLNGETPVIPGSSIKGAIRATCEALSNACLSNYALDNPPHNYRLPTGLEACNNFNQMCITCRMFGMAPQSQGSQEIFRGKLWFSDANYQCSNPQYDPLVSLIELSAPKPRHAPFYQDGNFLRGRKFYYHHDQLCPKGDRYVDDNEFARKLQTLLQQPNIAASNWGRRSTIRPISKGAVFEFTLEYRHLSDVELQLLVMGLELEPRLSRSEEDQEFFIPGCSEDFHVNQGVYHKLGYGKPAGLGSSAIIITSWEKFDLTSRYSASSGTGVEQVANVRDEINHLKSNYENQYRSETFFQDLMSILRYKNLIQEIRYPTNDEFSANAPFAKSLPLPASE